jgi:hypothetical protein
MLDIDVVSQCVYYCDTCYMLHTSERYMIHTYLAKRRPFTELPAVDVMEA